MANIKTVLYKVAISKEAFYFSCMFFLTSIASGALFAEICPDPMISSLHVGDMPEGWQLNPFSAHDLQAGDAVFLRANILVAGVGRGVVCNYQNALGDYSIWKEGLVKIPSRLTDIYWMDSLGGYACSASLDACTFTFLQ